jgi:hypothetical protein
MKCQFPFLTAGYLGGNVEVGTLNSKFYGFFISHEKDLEQPLIFPQRVPKSGFFQELLELESCHEITRRFSETIAHFNYQRSSLIESNSFTEYDENRLLNYSRLLLRFGQFSCLSGDLPKNASQNLHFELRAIREQAGIHALLSKNQPIQSTSVASLRQLALDVLVEKGLAEHIVISILNQYLVAAAKLTSYFQALLFQIPFQLG